MAFQVEKFQNVYDTQTERYLKRQLHPVEQPDSSLELGKPVLPPRFPPLPP